MLWKSPQSSLFTLHPSVTPSPVIPYTSVLETRPAVEEKETHEGKSLLNNMQKWTEKPITTPQITPAYKSGRGEDILSILVELNLWNTLKCIAFTSYCIPICNPRVFEVAVCRVEWLRQFQGPCVVDKRGGAGPRVIPDCKTRRIFQSYAWNICYKCQIYFCHVQGPPAGIHRVFFLLKYEYVHGEYYCQIVSLMCWNETPKRGLYFLNKSLTPQTSSPFFVMNWTCREHFAIHNLMCLKWNHILVSFPIFFFHNGKIYLPKTIEKFNYIKMCWEMTIHI